MGLHIIDPATITGERRKALLAIATTKFANLDNILHNELFRIPPKAYFIEYPKQKEAFIKWIKGVVIAEELTNYAVKSISSPDVREAYEACAKHAKHDDILSAVAAHYAVLDAVGKITLTDLCDALDDLNNKESNSYAMERCNPLIQELLKTTALSPEGAKDEKVIKGNVISTTITPIVNWKVKQERIIADAKKELETIYTKYPAFDKDKFAVLMGAKNFSVVDIDPDFVAVTAAMKEDFARAKTLFLLIADTEKNITKEMNNANEEFKANTLLPMRAKVVNDLKARFNLTDTEVEHFTLLQGKIQSGATFAPPCSQAEFEAFFSEYVAVGEEWENISRDLYYSIATKKFVKANEANKKNVAEFGAVAIASIQLLKSIIEGADYNLEGGRKDIIYTVRNVPAPKTKAIPGPLYKYYQELSNLEMSKGELSSDAFMGKFVIKFVEWCEEFSEAKMEDPLFQALFSNNKRAYLEHSTLLGLLRAWIDEMRNLKVISVINQLFPGNELSQGVQAKHAEMHKSEEALCYITVVENVATIAALEKEKATNAEEKYNFYWVPNASHVNGGTFYYYIGGPLEVELENYDPLQSFLSKDESKKAGYNKEIPVIKPVGYKIIQAVYVHRERMRMPGERPRTQSAASSSASSSSSSVPAGKRSTPSQGGASGSGLSRQRSMQLGQPVGSHTGQQFQLPPMGSQPVVLHGHNGPSTSAPSVAPAPARGPAAPTRQGSVQLGQQAVAAALSRQGSESSGAGSSDDVSATAAAVRKPAPQAAPALNRTESLPGMRRASPPKDAAIPPALPRRPSPPMDAGSSSATPVSSVSDTAAVVGQLPQAPRRGPSMPAVERKIVPLHQQTAKVVRHEDWEKTFADLRRQNTNTMAMSISNRTVYYAYYKEDGTFVANYKEDGTCVSKSIVVGEDQILKNGYACLSEKLLDLKGGFLGSNPEFERKDSTWYNVYHMICSAERIEPHQPSPPRVEDNGASSSSAQGASSRPPIRPRVATMKFLSGAAAGQSSSQQQVAEENAQPPVLPARPAGGQSSSQQQVAEGNAQPPVLPARPAGGRGKVLTQSGNSFAANPNGRGRGVPQPGPGGRGVGPQPGRGRGGQG